MRKTICIALLLILVMFSSFAGGSSEADTRSVSGEKSITVQTYSTNGSLLPYIMNTNAEPVTGNVYEPLFWLESDYERWCLALSYETTDDPNHVVINLRPDVTFSNGSAFAANDVIFTLEKYAELSATASYFRGLIDFDKTSARDDVTLDLWFNYFDPFWTNQFKAVLILDEETFDEQSAATMPIGTGPYKLESEYVAGVGGELIANESWWGGTPDITRVSIKEMDEDTQVTTALETGELDIAYLAPQADLWYLDEMDEFNTFVQSISKSNLTLFDISEGSPMASKEAREAVCWAIDNQSIISIAYAGLGADPKSMFSTADPLFKSYHTDINPIYSKNTSQIEKARELVKASGLDQATITIAVQATPTYRTEAELIQANLIKAGVKEVNILAIDNSSYYTALGDTSLWDIAITGMTCANGTGLDTFYNLFNSTMAYLTFPGESEFLQEIRDMFAITNTEERQAEADRLTAEIINNFYMYNNMDMSYGYVYRTNIKGFKVVTASRHLPLAEFSI